MEMRRDKETHGCSCGHCHEQDTGLNGILAGAGLFLLTVIPNALPQIFVLPVLVAAYFILGGKVLLTAVQNIRHGAVFDENFLMSLATLGAFGIGEYPEAVGVMLFYRIGEYFEGRAVEKSRRRIMEVVDMRPESVNRIVNGEVEKIEAVKAVVGDILLIRAGDRIPLDGIIAEGESQLDTSSLTGESLPIAVQPGSVILSGSINLSGVLHMQVKKVLAESMVSRILASVEDAVENKPRIARFITRFARVYTPIVVGTAVLVAVIPSLITGNWNYWVYTALTFLVISCPCALVLSVPLAFFSGIGAGSKDGIMFKGGAALEALLKVRVVIMDKTGTLTKGKFTVQNIVTAAAGADKNEVLMLAAACERVSTHPIGKAIVAAASEKKQMFFELKELSETAGRGIRARMGKEEILCGNRAFIKEHGVVLPEFASSGTEVFVAKAGCYMGAIFLGDIVKADAVSTVKQLHQLGLRTMIFTGDTIAVAEEIGKKLGIDEVRAQLLPQDKLAELQKVREKYGSVFFVGDGINDAPVLAGADVGGAMGSGADAAIEAADVVFMTSRVSAVNQAFLLAKQTACIARQNVVGALTVKAAIILLGFAGYASMWMAVFADSGVAALCVVNAMRLLYKKKNHQGLGVMGVITPKV